MTRLSCSSMMAPSRTAKPSGAQHCWSSHARTMILEATVLKWSCCCAGLLVPDIPLEETGPVREVATAAGLELVLLTTPTTPIERMEAIAKVSQGFVYLVSVTGTLLLSCCLRDVPKTRASYCPSHFHIWQ